MAKFITSKLQPTQYVEYIRNSNNNIPIVGRVVLINGGAGVTDRITLQTPSGVVTEVSDSDYEFLMNNKLFKDHMERGHVKVTGSSKGANTDTMSDDACHQLNEENYEERSEKSRIKVSPVLIENNEQVSIEQSAKRRKSRQTGNVLK